MGLTLDSEGYGSRPFRAFVKLLGKAYYHGSPYVRLGRIERFLRAKSVRSRLRNPDPQITDVLHIGTHDLPLVPLDATNAHKRPRHHLFTDTTWNLWRRHATNAGAVSARLDSDIDQLERRAYAGLDHFFVISEYVQRDLVETYGVAAEKITVVGTGRGGIAPFHGEKDYASGHILFVAKERFRDKGGEALLAGFALARQRMPELRLVIVGREEYRRRFGQPPGVTIHGHVAFETLQALFNRASLFAMPAVNEPWGLVYLEALSCRVPVLGLNRLSLPEITQDGRFGILLKNSSPGEIADALCRAMADPEGLARMGREGQTYCLENFTWERTAQRILDSIRKAAAEAACD